MTNRFSISSQERSSKIFVAEETRGRRLLEMHRRLKVLQVRRFHLQNELQSVEKYVTSLDSQIKGLESYQQLILDR